MHIHDEKRMILSEYGAESGGCSVIEHQKEETMAEILLARTGEGVSVSAG